MRYRPAPLSGRTMSRRLASHTCVGSGTKSSLSNEIRTSLLRRANPCFRAAACTDIRLDRQSDHLRSGRLEAMRLCPWHVNLVHAMLRAVRPRHRRTRQCASLYQVLVMPLPPLLVVSLAYPPALRVGHQLAFPNRQLDRYHDTTQALGLFPLRDWNHFPRCTHVQQLLYLYLELDHPLSPDSTRDRITPSL